MDIVRETATELVAEATSVNERRMLVLTGEREQGYAAVDAVLDAVAPDSAVALSDRDITDERIEFGRTDELLGTTYECIVVDCHDTCRPNAIGRATGAVDGGGLLVVILPDRETFLDSRGRFDESLASPPFVAADVTTRFKRRLIRTLFAHRGIAIIDVDANSRERHGLTEPVWRRPPETVAPPIEHTFPKAVYDACLTVDQRDAVKECEQLFEPGTAVVLEADRGRGKSSAAGLAAAAFATSGLNVLVTAPGYRNAAELFDRAAEMLDDLGGLVVDSRDGSTAPILRTETGEIRFLALDDAETSEADLLFVDEAAALPVRRLESLTAVAPSACFSTTVHGYEGAGRGFDVRFRDRLDELRDLSDCILVDPIRYGSGDPIEVWQFHALLLGASPPPGQLFADRTVEDLTYERIDRATLAENEWLLRELFGLLVTAHYRTEPDDLARLLDAPNIEIRALTADGHPVSVALLAREGGLDDELRRRAYEGRRIQGNLIPDLLTSQLRDPDAAVPVGLRVLRIATHHDVRSTGFGSRLLSEIESEFRIQPTPDRFGQIDYLGVSYGATPQLLDFWTANDYQTVHLSATRNDTSGEHSAVMVHPLSAVGHDLAERHGAWFRRRIPDVLSGALTAIDPDVVRKALAAVESVPPIELTDFEWRLVASAAYGPGLYDTAPGPFKRLALRTLVDEALDDADRERLLVAKVLQSRDWDETTELLEFVSRRECMRSLGDAFEPIVDRYGNELAHSEAARYRSE